MRTLTVAAIVMAVGSAFLLYFLNYETRRLEINVQALERSADKARTDIAVLKAERAHLARPERIEPLARALGLRPATGSQFARGQAGPVTGSTTPR
jgi:cell division protein FtsL